MAVGSIDQPRKQNRTDNIVVVINNQSVGQHFSDNFSGRKTDGTVAADFSQNLGIVTDGYSLRNNAADQFAFRIYDQAVSRNFADIIIIKTDDAAIRNNFSDQIAVKVDGGNLLSRGRRYGKAQHQKRIKKRSEFSDNT